MISGVDRTQRDAAKAVGFAYIITNAPAYFAEFHVRARLIDYRSAAITTANMEPTCFVPIGTFELILGFWLLFRGIRLPQTLEEPASQPG